MTTQTPTENQTRTADLPQLRRARLDAKRLADLLLAGAGLVVSSPVLAVCAAAVKLDDGGPVLFRQTRIGLRGRPFRILKLRSMRVANAGAQVTSAGDSRITRVGRLLRATKLDELPQLVNVVAGDMSLVGPPYALPELDTLPDLVFEHDLLAADGVFVFEHGKHNDFSAHPRFKEHRSYGSVNFSIFR